MSKGVDLIFEVWGNRMGHVFTPCKNPRTGEWTEQSFLWPKDRNRISEWITESEADKKNIYWCPTLFTQPIRKKEYIEKVQVLWADLDEVKPTGIPRNIRPHLAYETSPKRYQALWYLKKDEDPEEAEAVNRNLTYFIGADKGGWDLTQVLRIPGLRNFKYKNGPEGKILWDEVEEKSLAYFEKRVPEYESETVEDEDIEWAEPDELVGIVAKYRDKLKGKLFDLIFASEDEVAEYDRSSKLWEIECRLFEVGVETSDVANIVRLSNWNKYRDRNDEKKRIMTEVLKAKAETASNKEEAGQKFEGRTGKVFESYADLMGLSTSNPGWLVEGWWQRGSHGMVAGEPKTYKSTFVADFASSVASGQPLYGQYAVHHQGPVIMIQEENSPYLMKDRFRKVANHKGLLNGKVYVRGNTAKITFPPNLPISFLNNKGFDFTSEESRILVEEEIKKVKPVLVIFDPLYLMLGGKDENSSKDVRPVLNWLLNLRYTYNTAIMLVHHWNKGGQSTRSGQRMLGSVLFHGWVESAVYNLVKDEAEHEVTVDREFRSFPKPKPISVKYNMGNPGDDYYEPIVTAEEPQDDTSDQLYLFIASSNGVTEQEICDATDMTRQNVRTAVKNLKKKGLIDSEKRGRSMFWFAIKVTVDEET